MSERIGIIVGWEESFPQAFIARVNQTPGFRAELAKLGGITEVHQPPYRVLIDRLSHEVPYYRFFLKTAAVAVPRTVMLPQHSYIPSIDPKRSLRNLEHPLDWQGILSYIGFPAILKPADGGGWKNVTRVDSLEQLMRAYDASGTLVMTLQQFIDFEEYVRCICIGKEFILPIKYDPKRRCYVEADGFLSKELENKILDGAWALNSALGYDMNSVESAIKDGVPYAIDFTNPAPDMDVHSILPRYFHEVVEQMATFAMRCAREGRKNHGGYAFRQYLERPAPRPGASPTGARIAS